MNITEWPVLSRYDEAHLREISMPIGGIGTGFFSLGGGGQLLDWQLMSRPNRGWRPAYSHLMLHTNQNGKLQLKVMEQERTWGLNDDFGAQGTLLGVPRFRHASFEATYPYGRVNLDDEDSPVKVSIEGFNPLIPHDSNNSSLPFGVLTLKVTNTSLLITDASITLLLTNFVGTDGITSQQRGCVNNHAEFLGWRGLQYSSTLPVQSSRFGSIAVLSDAADVRVARRWAFQGRPWNGEQLAIIDHLLQDGYIPDAEESQNCETAGEGSTWHSSITSILPGINAGECRTVNLLITWHFPLRNQEEEQWWSPAQGISPFMQNWYAQFYKNALDVAVSIIPRLPELQRRTHQFVESVVSHPAPHALREAALFNLTPLRTHTCFRTLDGTFFGWEGCGGTAGCCTGSCTHVWNYEEATVHLFPDLHKSMLESHLAHGVVGDGGERFRISLPLVNQTWNGAAADGQMGLIVRCYEQTLVDGVQSSTGWLEKWYPTLKKMLQFAWVEGGWDADKDGVMEGTQHNTYDVEFIGPNPLCNVWYLAALEAMSIMAKRTGDIDFSTLCSSMRNQGSRWMDSNLYNGRYYVQHIEPQPMELAPMTSISGLTGGEHPQLQLGAGCLIDQLVGQYKANRCGLPTLLDEHHIHTTVRSIFHNNHLSNMRDHYNNMRTFAIGDEPGTVICSYPDGNRPAVPFPYFGECMTGFEYQLAVLLLDVGMRKEAVQVASSVRFRHNGSNRNPFNEQECGSFYARSMAAWALLNAWNKQV